MPMAPCGSALTISDSAPITVALTLQETPREAVVAPNLGASVPILTLPRRPASRARAPCRDLLKRLGPESGGADLAWLAKHLVDLACVQLFGVDHLPRVFLDES
jgi:hypothetical protein